MLFLLTQGKEKLNPNALPSNPGSRKVTPLGTFFQPREQKSFTPMPFLLTQGAEKLHP